MDGPDNAYEAITDGRTTRAGRSAPGSPTRSPASTPTVPAGVDGDDLAAYCLMLGDDALVMSHRLQQWCTHAPTLEDEVALANIAPRPARPGSSAADPGRRGRRQRPRRGRLRLLPATPASSATSASSSSTTATSPSASARLLRLRHVAAGAARPAGGLARPGAGGDRRQGREGADLPPRLRRAVGRPPRRRHRVLSPARAWRRLAAIAAVRRRAVRRLGRRDAASPTSASAVDPASCAPSSTRCSPPCCRGHAAPPRRWSRDSAGATRTAGHRDALTRLLAELQSLARADPEATW